MIIDTLNTCVVEYSIEQRSFNIQRSVDGMLEQNRATLVKNAKPGYIPICFCESPEHARETIAAIRAVLPPDHPAAVSSSRGAGRSE